MVLPNDTNGHDKHALFIGLLTVMGSRFVVGNDWVKSLGLGGISGLGSYIYMQTFGHHLPNIQKILGK